MEYRLRWVPGVGSLCGACTFHALGDANCTRRKPVFWWNMGLCVCSLQVRVDRSLSICNLLVGVPVIISLQLGCRKDLFRDGGRGGVKWNFAYIFLPHGYVTTGLV